MPRPHRRLLAFATIVVAALSAWFVHRDPSLIDDDGRLRQITEHSTRSVAADIASDVRVRLAALTAIALALPTSADPTNNALREAGRFLRAYPSHLFVQWVEPNLEVRWTLHGDRLSSTELPFTVHHAPVRDAIRTASAREEVVVSRTIAEHDDGPRAVAVIVPVVDAGHVRGFLVAAVDVVRLIDVVLADHLDLGYAISVSDSSQELYRTTQVADGVGQQWAQELPVNLAGASWQVRVWPDARTVHASRSALAEITWLLGGWLVFALALTAHGAHAERVKATKVFEARNELERHVRTRTAELERANESLRELSARLLHLQDEERRRIARELHDSTVQTLAACAISVEGARHAMRDGELSEADIAFGQAGAYLDAAVKEVRTLSYLLHPPVLDEIGLASAIEWYTRGFSARSGIVLTASVPCQLERMPRDVELTLFRILQEALTNVHRHSGSRAARVALTRGTDSVSLEIEDFGKGLQDDGVTNAAGPPATIGVGIAGMRERVRQLGGTIEFRNTGSGTLIRTVLPTASAIAQPFISAPAD
jgi:signal transduction histidine kinase